MATTPSVNTPISLWKSILVPTDFSPPADAALAHALTLALVSGATLHVCHAIPVPHVLDAMYERGLQPPESVKRIWQNARRHIKAITNATPNGENVTLRIHFSEGDAVSEVLAWALKLTPDLIVMGTHGRKGTKRFFMGSVAEAVVRRANCPVLTLRGESAATAQAAAEKR
jgi:nucleotide-binding universal stress UspA family protein